MQGLELFIPDCTCVSEVEYGMTTENTNLLLTINVYTCTVKPVWKDLPWRQEKVVSLGRLSFLRLHL